ncbi:MAG: alanine racemase [Candidatus Aureabacteria bacterium]|nr:alanine racemase [Candidatus Auribacterota bacterium]
MLKRIMTEPSHFLQWITLSKANLKHNIGIIRSHCSSRVEIAGILKANAYGHGLLPMAQLFRQCGLGIFMVHTLDEALTLHESGSKERIILLGPVAPAQIPLCLKKGFELTVYTQEILSAIKKAQKILSHPAKIHVKIETGTNRQGLDLKNIPDFISLLKSIQYELRGLSSHFANIEDTADTSYYKKQIQCLKHAVRLFKKGGVQPDSLHIACSAAVLLYPETHFQLIRPGISLYGYYSSPEVAYALKPTNPLRPVLSWKTRLVQIKNVGKGDFIGYGLTYKAMRKSKIGILPIGYYDGYDRKLSNQGYVLVRGKRAGICGRICMNICMVDLTDIPEAKTQDVVTLLGKDGKESITADHLAAMTNTISYEILARLNPLIPRIVE